MNHPLPRHLRSRIRLRGARLAVAVGLATLLGCKDEKTRLPFITVPTPTSTVTGPTAIPFSVADREGNIAAVSVSVSRDGGRTFVPATPQAGQPAQVLVAALPAGAGGTFLWDPVRDLGPGIHRDVVLSVAAF